MLRTCPDCKIEKNLQTDFSKNKHMSGGREYYCKICRKIRRKKWEQTGNNLQKKLEATRIYKKTSEFKNRRNIKDKIKRDSNLLIKIMHNLRSRTRKAFLGFYKDQTTKKLLGCGQQELMNYLINKFDDKMTLDNYGEWHIDHIIPLSTAKTKEELEKLCHYSNLQPLWAIDNLRKNKNYAKI